MAYRELSEKELLLLTNYAYFKCSTYDGTIGENIQKLKDEKGEYDISKVTAQGACGDIISEEDAIDILKRIEEDERLSSLSAVRKMDNEGMRGILYEDQNGKKATLVFRGTGGTYKAWEDNVLGEYQTDTRIQKLAADFVKYECAEYDDITVTGHSKGGNLSQYVTVVCGGQIDRCVSFDGQGFSEKFRSEHDEEIEIAKDKIKSISGYNDFVNILLTPIASEILFVNNQKGIGVDMHSCYTMLSNGIFDADGNFDRSKGVIPQDKAMKLLNFAGDSIVSLIDKLPEDGNEKASNVLAAWVASIFSNDKGEEYEKKRTEEAIKDFRSYTRTIAGIPQVDICEVNCISKSLVFQTENVKQIYSQLEDIRCQMIKYPEIAEDVLVRIDYSILGRSFTENALKRVIARLDAILQAMKKYDEILQEAILSYEMADVLT